MANNSLRLKIKEELGVFQIITRFLAIFFVLFATCELFAQTPPLTTNPSLPVTFCQPKDSKTNTFISFQPISDDASPTIRANGIFERWKKLEKELALDVELETVLDTGDSSFFYGDTKLRDRSKLDEKFDCFDFQLEPIRSFQYEIMEDEGTCRYSDTSYLERILGKTSIEPFRFDRDPEPIFSLTPTDPKKFFSNTQLSPRMIRFLEISDRSTSTGSSIESEILGGINNALQAQARKQKQDRDPYFGTPFDEGRIPIRSEFDDVFTALSSGVQGGPTLRPVGDIELDENTKGFQVGLLYRPDRDAILAGIIGEATFTAGARSLTATDDRLNSYRRFNTIDTRERDEINCSLRLLGIGGKYGPSIQVDYDGDKWNCFIGGRIGR